MYHPFPTMFEVNNIPKTPHPSFKPFHQTTALARMCSLSEVIFNITVKRHEYEMIMINMKTKTTLKCVNTAMFLQN